MACAALSWYDQLYEAFFRISNYQRTSAARRKERGDEKEVGRKIYGGKGFH